MSGDWDDPGQDAGGTNQIESFVKVNILLYLRAKGKKMQVIMIKEIERNQLLVKMKSKKMSS